MEGQGVGMQHIKLLAAMSDAKMLRALRAQIARQDEVQLVGAPKAIEQTLRAVMRTHPDVLLLDASSECTWRDPAQFAAIHRSAPDTKILPLLGPYSEHSIAWTLEHGARGYISTCAFPEGCLPAIRAVARGEVWVGRKELTAILDGLLNRLGQSENSAAESAAVLSQRELEIAEGVRLGLTNKEIARRMCISPTTVKTHLEHIFHKLRVSHRVQLAILTPGLAPRYAPAAGVR